ncbi:hypothetical protein ACIOEX_02965 [Streptomyces sp. NPDC087850]|uniref:hypothetical protein n=1 Tax=Streptomyces sp. NPDC087850 TaxID=3365809 RepID=UPI00380F311C
MLPMPEERPQGVNGVVRLFSECRARAPGGRELPVVALLGRRGGGKTTTLRWLGYLASNRPNAFYDFASAPAKRPHEVATRLALGLSYRFPRQPPVQFPRLALGLLVTRLQLSLDDADTRKARAELKRGLRQARSSPEAREAVGEAGEVLGVLQDLNLVPLPGINLVLRLVQFSLPRLPVTMMWRAGLTWYGDTPHRTVDALVALNQLAKSDEPEKKAQVDRQLCGAFLEDLRAHDARHGQSLDKVCVALLDNIDVPQGREFLDLLVRIRDANAAADGVHDPLLVVATAANARAVPGPYAPGLPAELRVRPPEQASYADWERSIPRPASTTRWHWYPVLLRDLTEPEIMVLAEQLAPPPVHTTPLVHRLSYGHPWSARTLLDAVYAIVERGGGAPELRQVLRTLTSVPGPPEVPRTVDEAARRYLLRDLSPSQQSALVACSAARAFESAVDAGLLEAYDQHTKDSLHRDIDALLWLIPPVPEDAGTRGGRGSGYLEYCREENRPPSTLQPWLRLVLLQALAAQPAGDRASWESAHQTLRAWHQGREGARRHRLDAQYHSLALNELDGTVAYLHDRFTDLPTTDQWLYELYTITAAPMRVPVVPLGPDEPQSSPSDRVRELAGQLGPTSLTENWSLTMLVTALWLAADPRNRVANAAPELNSTIAAMFHRLAALPSSSAAGLLREAGRYEPRP